jgi:hypothetical protein
MRSVMSNTREWTSPRWARFCEHLKLVNPGDKWQAFGHLWRWYQRWAGDPELETGVWFDISQATIGSWAEVLPAEAARWGRALHAAGFVRTLKEAYPEPLGTERRGWVAVDCEGGAMLDASIVCFVRRPDFERVLLYCTHRDKRVSYAASQRLDVARLEAEGKIPPGWLSGGTQRARRPGWQAPAAAEQQADDEEPGPMHASAPGTGPGIEPGAAAGPGLRPGRPAAAPRVVRGFGGAEPPEGGSAPPKTRSMLHEIRALKYNDPLEALRLIDGSERAMHCWKQALGRDAGRVMQEIGNLVETDERWALVRKPAAVLMSNFIRAGLVGGKA